MNSGDVLVAVDGGNWKTDLALLRTDGRLLSLVRGPLSSPHHLGVEGTVRVLEELLHEAACDAGLAADGRVRVDVAELLLAGIDFPTDEEEVRDAVAGRGFARLVRVDNDTFAVLRAGTEEAWGVAVTCGSGINCVGVGRDGRVVRFPALGTISGDWGGGYDVGLAAVSAAARSEDGRGPKTSLERAVPAHFGLSTPAELAEAIHRREIDLRRVIELAPAVLEAAAADGVAEAIVRRQADEVVAFVRAAAGRLDLTDERVPVVLGGGLFQSGNRLLSQLVSERVRELAPAAVVRPVDSPPIVGAALLALDHVSASDEAARRARGELQAAAAARDGARHG
jgi:N-acetylglucosamine kinase-like BadF-type ATPase